MVTCVNPPVGVGKMQEKSFCVHKSAKLGITVCYTYIPLLTVFMIWSTSWNEIHLNIIRSVKRRIKKLTQNFCINDGVKVLEHFVFRFPSHCLKWVVEILKGFLCRNHCNGTWNIPRLFYNRYINRVMY